MRLLWDICLRAGLLTAALAAVLAFTNAHAALDAQTVAKLGSEDANTKNEAVNALVASGDEAALALLLAVQAGESSVTPAGRVVIVKGDQVFDAATMAPIISISPCAMLMTPSRPYVIARPSATSNRMLPSDNPVNSRPT